MKIYFKKKVCNLYNKPLKSRNYFILDLFYFQVIYRYIWKCVMDNFYSKIY